jgi:hypothetical protein
MSALHRLIVLLTALFASAEIRAATAPISNEPPINAQYKTTACAKPCTTTNEREWWIFRTPEQVELRDIDTRTGQLGKYSEIWKHTSNEKLGYLFLMHDDKRAIEYLFDDLKVLNINADEHKWQVSSQLVSDDELARMQKLAKKTDPYHGYLTESYTGKINDADVEVTWLPQLHIPEKIIYFYPRNTVTVALEKLSTTPDNNLSTSEETLNSYQQVYYTDIGDMEQNADAQEWIAKAQGAPGLHSHQH